MLIKMTETKRYTEDGHTVRQYFKGHIYEPRDHVAKQAIKDGVAIKVDEFGNDITRTNKYGAR